MAAILLPNVRWNKHSHISLSLGLVDPVVAIVDHPALLSIGQKVVIVRIEQLWSIV
jgi:hypothetical protein